MPTPLYRAKLVNTLKLSPNTIELEFVRCDDGYTSYTPGQFFKFGFDIDGDEVQRSFSVSTRHPEPSKNKKLHIAIAAVASGKATNFFFHAKSGTEVNVYGPYGQLLLPDTLPPRLILIGTGTGVAPYRSMIPLLEHHLSKTPSEIHLVMGARREGEMLYDQEFIELHQQHPNFHYHACYSQQLPDQPEVFEQFGHVQDSFAQIKPNKNTDLIYLCGNPNMVDEVFHLLKTQDFGVKNVKREKYVFAVRR